MKDVAEDTKRRFVGLVRQAVEQETLRQEDMALVLEILTRAIAREKEERQAP